MSNFCAWILSDDNKGVTCIAHNFGGYDGQFILRHILEHGTMKPDVIMNGNTIMRMTVGKVTFLDSYLFLHMRLANFPKTFGLTEMKKGYFSIKAVRWIQSVAYENEVEIKHALNGGEVKICGHYVDGYHEASKTIF